ncbi:MAG TPA: hypothetical protein VI953_04910 [Candidatus Paceibacterota bacterium]
MCRERQELPLLPVPVHEGERGVTGSIIGPDGALGVPFEDRVDSGIVGPDGFISGDGLA